MYKIPHFEKIKKGNFYFKNVIFKFNIKINYVENNHTILEYISKCLKKIKKVFLF